MNDTWDELNGLYFDKDSKEISMRRWTELFQDPEYKIIRRTDLPNGKHVSTVWLGLDHGFGNRFTKNPFYLPVIFETMVFPECNEMDRYHTLEEAIAGHEAMVKKIAGRSSQTS